MKSKLLLLAICVFSFSITGYAQEKTLEELKAMKAEKEGIRDNVDTEIADIDKLIKEFPGWSRGFAGTLGFDFGGLNNWYADDIENVSSSGIGLSFGAYANKNNEKSFWHNNANATLTSKTARNTDIDENTGITATQEEELTSKGSFFALNSLAGYQIFNKLYGSAEARYETTLLNFNDPGKLTFSAGFTYKPINDLVIIIHPLGYQWTFPGGTFSSSPGAKIGATYAAEILPGVAWTSNFNAFLSYSGDENTLKPDGDAYTSGDLSNWTWLNGFTIADVFKGVGVGLNLGLRSDDQLGYSKNVADPGLQTFYTVGLTYALSN